MSFSGGFNRNVGNYNSVKYSCTLTLPCLLPEIDDVFAFAEEWVEQKLEKKMDEITEVYGA